MNVWLIGGEKVIPASVEKAIEGDGYTVKRISGEDRYETAAAIAEAGIKLSGKKPSKVFVASGTSFADALAVSPVAFIKGYPIILTEKDSTSDFSKKELGNIGTDAKILIGGEAVVSKKVAADLSIKEDARVAGDDRAVTANKVADWAKQYEGFNPANAALVGGTNGNGADSLVAASLAGKSFTTLHFAGWDATNVYFKDHARELTGKGFVFGGKAAVSQGDVDKAQAAAQTPAASNQSYSIAGGTSGQTVSTITGSDSDNKGVVVYKVTGLPKDVAVNVALFPSTGDNAPKVSASGSVVFASAAGEKTAGNAAGLGTTTVAGGAFITSVNGVPTTGSPKAQYQLSSDGTLTFAVDSTKVDSVTPVVYTAPKSGGTQPALGVDADGMPQTGFAIGTGTSTAWIGADAPKVAAGSGYTATVVSVDTKAKTFQGAVAGGAVYNFAYGNAGTTYRDKDDKPLGADDFSAELSGGDVNARIPNTKTAAPVVGDTVLVGDNSGYSSKGATDIKLVSDVAAAPSSLTAAYSATAVNNTSPGVLVTWKAPVNDDVVSYQLFRSAVDSKGAYGEASAVGNVSVITSGTATNLVGGSTLAKTPQVIDTTAAAGTSYVYYVRAVNTANVAGDFSASSNAAMVGKGLSAPVVKSVVIIPSTAGTLDTATGAVTGAGVAGKAIITYDQNVVALNPAASAFSYSNTGGSGAIKGKSLSVSGKTLTVTFDQSYVKETAADGTKTYAQVEIANSANGDSFAYAVPSSATTANTVWVGDSSNPIYSAAQSVSDNGKANAGTTISNPLADAASAPRSVSATVSTTKVNVGWTAPASAGEVANTGYIVIATSADNGAATPVSATTVDSSARTAQFDTGALTSGKSYTVSVYVKSGLGTQGSPAGTATVTAP